MELELETNGMFEDHIYDFGCEIDGGELDNERCGICMDGIVDRGVLDCCEHWFCFACIDNWATITNLCPLCQNEFQMITCVPVYDTIGSGKVEDESLSRDDDWCIQGTNNTVSFPSYYIDENAVICLDGNGCKIRNGAGTSGDDSVLDTSIACDSCDIWYHAFCVDFDPESTSESSWLCPRCIDEVPQKSDGVSVQTANYQNSPESSSHEHSVEASQCGKVSVSVADAGETAVVVSMIEGNPWLKGPSEDCLSDHDTNINHLALSLSQGHFPVDPLQSNNLETDFTEEEVPEPIVSGGCQLFTSLFSDKPVVKNNLSRTESGFDLHLGLSMGPTLPGDNLSIDATENIKLDASEQHDLCKGFALSADKMVIENNDDAGGPICMKRKSMSPGSPNTQGDHALAIGRDEADNIDIIHEITANPPAKKAKQDRKSKQILQKDQSRKTVSEDSQECSHLLAGSKDNVGNSKPVHEMPADPPPKKAKGVRKPQPNSRKDESRTKVSEGSQENSHPLTESKDEVLPKVPAKKAKIDGKLEQTHSNSNAKNTQEPTSVPDIMSIVRETNRRRKPASSEKDNGSKLRVKKIMRRASEEDSSKAVENLRKEIREAVRSKATQDTNKPKVFDPELLLAFRNALAGTRSENDPPKRIDPSVIRAKRLMLQKGKARESLTKKIYGNSNGRRKRAWDRDWEVEFWKHRCTHASKPEKVDTLTSVLNLLRKGPDSSKIENEPEKDSPNPILSRLYLADSSVFPRTDDIKPLSAFTGPGNEKTSKPANNQMPKNSFQCSKEVAAPKNVHPNGLINKQNSTPTATGSKVNDQSLKDMPVKSDVKTDKRKWALEILARKNAPTVQSNKTQEKVDANAILKGNFPLLAQLPLDMRPILATSRHNKVPVSVRQAQLHRVTEHFLRKVDVPVSQRSADTELAVADAINTEKEVIDKSNSKIVYLNLISQYIKNNTKPEKAPEPEQPSSELTENASESEQPSSPQLASDPPPKVEDSDISGEEALRMAGLLSDSPPNSPSDDDKEPDNVFDIDTHVDLDIYGDFEYDLENDDFIGGVLPKSKPQVEESDSKMKVIFSTLKTEKQNDDTIELVPLDVKTSSSSPPTEPLQEEIGGEMSLDECEELYGPDKEPLVNRFPQDSRETVLLTKELLDDSLNGVSIPKEKTLVTTGLPENSSNGSSASVSISRKEKEKSSKKMKQSDIVHSVSKKVETYIKEHIRPLCKSGVITVDQYRYAVERTTVKIMKYHSKDTNANFLIKEGEKVKKLAEQYVEAAQKKDSSC
ncbi:hypothetical protein ACHQM5_011904 [Ranunculus cassubicifolius]